MCAAETFCQPLHTNGKLMLTYCKSKWLIGQADTSMKVFPCSLYHVTSNRLRCAWHKAPPEFVSLELCMNGCRSCMQLHSLSRSQLTQEHWQHGQHIFASITLEETTDVVHMQMGEGQRRLESLSLMMTA